MSIIFQKSHFSNFGFRTPASRALLAPPMTVSVNQTAGFKIKYSLKKRCKDCFIYVKDGRRSILCPTHGRHKQLNPVKKPRYTWTIALAMQSKVRPW
ncbi:unnamed protein product [Nesidiocoris tenuis]|uniref:Large ribosomal subunit protein bL36m n=1 Tax=Nesidiocoris tenuis TaxID=355587 RepID=A0A6H5H5L9_9HEMI|nr:unnamed protein product [Nesidiocoris tenuis]